MLYETRFLTSLAATLAIEIPVVFILVKYIFKNKSIKWYRLIFITCLASVLTLPYLWFVLYPFIDAKYYTLVGETSVTAIEGLIYFQLLRIRIDKALIISIIANLASFFIGRFILSSF